MFKLSRSLNSKVVSNLVKDPNLNFDPLTDSFGRFHSYLRISLTEKCNLRCTYCMPEEGVPLTPSAKLLSTEEILRLTRIFAENGVDKVRLTGGEPTIRADLTDIIHGIREIGTIKDIGITSNGIVLKRKIDQLVKAGLNKLNLSLDTLDPHKYMIMTRRNGFNKIMDSIEASLPLFPMVKLNCVVIRGVNDDEVIKFVEFTRDKNIDIRFIEYMPFGGNKFESKKMVPYKEMMTKIGTAFDNQVVRLKDKPNDTSKAYKVMGFKGQFGFITSMSTPFCSTCNRLRITADGMSSWKGGGLFERSDERRSRGSPDSGSHSEGASRKEETTCRYGRSFHHSKPSNDLDWRMTSLNSPSISVLFQIRYFSTTFTISYSKLSHVDDQGKASMVDVTDKKDSVREAVAEGFVIVPDNVMDALKNDKIKKGDALTVAKLAGIMGAKKTAELIPLCHPIPLTHIKVELELIEANKIKITASTKTKTNTGVEMEALMAVSISALTLYDMCKALSQKMVISEVRLIKKTGGKADYTL